MMIKGNFPYTLFFISHGGKVYGTVEGPKYYVSPIPNRDFDILINAEFKIAPHQLPYIDSKKLLRKITMSRGILLQMEIWTWKRLARGWGVNDETEDVLVIDCKGGDEDDDDAIDYIHSDDAVASKMAVDEQ